MFTGIIEEVGKVQHITKNEIKVQCVTVLEDTKLGDSISVNGVCLTVKDMTNSSFSADVSKTTFDVTSMKKLSTNSYVNLERAMKCDGRFGGHIVSGHVDGVGKIKSIFKNAEFYNFQIELAQEQIKYVAKKGSISVDGISLTVSEIDDNIISIAIIPHTIEKTNLKYAKVGEIVNIEVDIISKYIEKFLSTGDNRSRIDLKFLQENGF